MSIIDKIENIGSQINELYEFINNNADIKEDWEEYKKTLSVNNENKAKSVSIPYIFERKLKHGTTDVISIYIENQEKLSRIRKKILTSFQNFQNTIFEVKKVAKNGFELYNLVNEKTYFVISMVKMTHFRQIGSGDYVIARIIEFESDYYLIELSDAINANQKEACYKFAVSKIMENPQCAYYDNKEKQKVIEKSISKMYNKFFKLFKKDTIITSNKIADDIIEIFNNFENNEKSCDDEHLQKLLDIKPEKQEFYKIDSLDIEYNNFIAFFMHLISYLEINKLKICVSFLSKYFTIFSISYIISPFNTFSICSLSASSDNTFKLELLFFNIATALFKLFCFAKSCKSSSFNLLAYIPFNFALILGYFIAEIDIFFHLSSLINV